MAKTEESTSEVRLPSMTSEVRLLRGPFAFVTHSSSRNPPCPPSPPPLPSPSRTFERTLSKTEDPTFPRSNGPIFANGQELTYGA
jgi:hypothetical protein